MATQADIINDWHRHLDTIGSEHRHVLRNTLPTPSFGLLLESYVREQRERLQELDLDRPPQEFKDRYRSIRLQQDIAESLLDFVKSLSEAPI